MVYQRTVIENPLMNTRFIKYFLRTLLVVSTTAFQVSAQVPASTLTKPSSATTAPHADGFIQSWLILEPVPANGLTDSLVQALVKGHSPNQLTAVPRDGDRVMIAGTEVTWHAVATSNYNVNLFHFARSYAKKTSDVLFWAVTIVNSPREIHDVRLAIGSNAASVWWVNDKEVIGIYGDRQAVVDDGVSKRLTLKKGPNILRAAVINGGGATDYCARFLDEEDRPLKEITISLIERTSLRPQAVRNQKRINQRVVEMER